MSGHSDAPDPKRDSTAAEVANQLMLGIGVELKVWEGGGQAQAKTQQRIGLLVRAARSMLMSGPGSDAL
jgi:hypothetical protein